MCANLGTFISTLEPKKEETTASQLVNSSATEATVKATSSPEPIELSEDTKVDISLYRSLLSREPNAAAILLAYEMHRDIKELLATIKLMRAEYNARQVQ